MDLTLAHLTIAEIYDFTLSNGVTAFFTSHNEEIRYGGNYYQPIPIKRDKISYHINLQVDKVKVSLGLVGAKVGAQEYTMAQVVKNDFLRNAHVVISRIDYIALGTPDVAFEGWVTGDINFNEGILVVEVGSILDRLRDSFPSFLYTSLCNHQLYGPYCTVSRASFVESGTADAGSNEGQVFDAILLYSNQPLDYWYKGELKFTSGENAGIAREVVKHNNGDVQFLIPFPNPVAVGDSFDCWPGCDKTSTRCIDIFNNLSFFGGFEYIPKPEMLYFP